MPRVSEATKDAISCDKAGGGAHTRYIPAFPNGATPHMEDVRADRLDRRRQTQGTETSKYLQEKKITMIPQVVASERGGAQTRAVTAALGL